MGGCWVRGENGLKMRVRESLGNQSSLFGGSYQRRQIRAVFGDRRDVQGSELEIRWKVDPWSTGRAGGAGRAARAVVSLSAPSAHAA